MRLDVIVTSGRPMSTFQGTTTAARDLLAASTLGTWADEVLSVLPADFEAVCVILIDTHKLHAIIF